MHTENTFGWAFDSLLPCFVYHRTMNIAVLERKIRRLEKARERLVAKAQAQSEQKLLALPKQVGLRSVAELIAALSGLRGKGGRGLAAKTSKKRKRAKITEATRASVKKLAGAGKTGAQIARALKISVPSVQNIKKALGLVQARKR